MKQMWSSDTPIYIQLYHQVIQRILDGHIQEGEALPSVRNVAAEYQLNPVTISKAYQMLQDEVVVEKQRGKGLFVKQGVQTILLTRERETFVKNEWPKITRKIESLQLSVEELLSAYKERK
ncbi:GntR family transcriptional regulator [Paraglaciecola sp.]|uniref:GntR family transcriptional regulator n=1 Tax=Paraglaciecola sp. TaxID=1920173 RepID=UPI003EF0F8BE